MGPDMKAGRPFVQRSLHKGWHQCGVKGLGSMVFLIIKGDTELSLASWLKKETGETKHGHSMTVKVDVSLVCGEI